MRRLLVLASALLAAACCLLVATSIRARRAPLLLPLRWCAHAARTEDEQHPARAAHYASALSRLARERIACLDLDLVPTRSATGEPLWLVGHPADLAAAAAASDTSPPLPLSELADALLRRQHPPPRLLTLEPKLALLPRGDAALPALLALAAQLRATGLAAPLVLRPELLAALPPAALDALRPVALAVRDDQQCAPLDAALLARAQVVMPSAACWLRADVRGALAQWLHAGAQRQLAVWTVDDCATAREVAAAAAAARLPPDAWWVISNHASLLAEAGCEAGGAHAAKDVNDVVLGRTSDRLF